VDLPFIWEEVKSSKSASFLMITLIGILTLGLLNKI